MSAKPSDLDFITRPEDLGLPPEADEVLSHLTPGGSAAFSQEIMRALMQAQSKGNLRPVRDVVEAWYRTLVLRSQPDYMESIAWAQATHPREGSVAEELLTHLAD